jgi:hypothetical protein
MKMRRFIYIDRISHNHNKTEWEESKMRKRFKDIISANNSVLSLVLISALVMVFMLSAAGTARPAPELL